MWAGQALEDSAEGLLDIVLLVLGKAHAAPSLEQERAELSELLLAVLFGRSRWS